MYQWKFNLTQPRFNIYNKQNKKKQKKRGVRKLNGIKQNSLCGGLIAFTIVFCSEESHRGENIHWFSASDERECVAC